MQQQKVKNLADMSKKDWPNDQADINSYQVDDSVCTTQMETSCIYRDCNAEKDISIIYNINEKKVKGPVDHEVSLLTSQANQLFTDANISPCNKKENKMSRQISMDFDEQILSNLNQK